MEYLVVKILYGVITFLKWLYLSSDFGFKIYNFITSNFSKLVHCQSAEPIHIGRNFAGFELQKRFYQLAPSVSQRMIENFIWANIIGSLRRKRLHRKGIIIPSVIVISPTYRCNLKCYGCYARGRQGELPLGILEKILTEQEKLGIFSVYLTGGEPFMRKDLWQIFQKYPRTVFTVYTNGTLLGEKEVEKIAQLGNIRLMISLEGSRDFTEKRRGKGVYQKVMKLLKLCQKANIFYGLSVTVAKENFKYVASKDFLKKMSNWKPLLVNYFMYIRYGNENFPTHIDEEEASKLSQWQKEVKNHYPLFIMLGRGGSNLVEDCVAAEQRIHITANGDVEPCVFCHWSADNIEEKTILEVMESRFFRLIRSLNSYQIPSFNPCQEKGCALFKKAGACKIKNI